MHVYTDGCVLVNHGGTEMGQGLNTKVAQVVAHELGLPFERVRCTATDTQKVANTTATAASTGSDLNGKAAQDAARQIRERLAAFAAGKFGVRRPRCASPTAGSSVAGQSLAFADLVQQAYLARVQLWSDGFYATPGLSWDKATMQGQPFYYFAYGAACSEVLVDTLTGEWKLLRADLLHDAGKSLNPAIDIGQIEGAFIQGMGWLTSEELVWHPADGSPQAGLLTTHAPSTYKIPTANDARPMFDTRLFDRRQRAGHHPPQQGRGRAAAAAALLGVLRDPRRGLGRRRPPRRPAAAGAGHARGHPARRDRRHCGSGAPGGALELPTPAAAKPRPGRRAPARRWSSKSWRHAARCRAKPARACWWPPTPCWARVGGGHLELQAIADARALLAAAAPVQLRRATSRWAPRWASAAAARSTCATAAGRQRRRPPGSRRPPRFHLQLYGAGHVGRAIVRLLAGLPCEVQWIDERESEFPAAAAAVAHRRVCVEPVEAEVAAAPPGACFLVLTHSHVLDLAITQAILARGDFAFFGLIGSKTKRARFEPGCANAVS